MGDLIELMADTVNIAGEGFASVRFPRILIMSAALRPANVDMTGE